ncbi:hypothetical protein LTR84_011137 [Exophiala bonariae]|uniref:Myb-like domain-containing protein n=1 Tax=Exophiala bonariae TaxID=1690606 RepID=A0AAV9NKW4_9EURO|nr:hypothetical protein LTR84_011137 [Exophiala bonariae]
MPVSTRRSLAAQADEVDQSAAGQPDVTTIMNDLAGNISQTPARKHPRPSGDLEQSRSSPKKMLTVDLRHPRSANSTPGVPSPRRTSGKLKTRASLPAPTPARSRMNWQPDDDDIEQGVEVPIELPKKSILLGKRKPPDKSPFKGKGTLQTKSSARVNLDDSPPKSSRQQNLDKISKSLLKHTRPNKKTVQLKRVKNATRQLALTPRRSGRPTIAAGDPFQDAQQDDDPITPGLGNQPPERQSQKEFSPLKADRRAKRKVVFREEQQAPPSGQGDNQESSDEPSNSLPRIENTKIPKLIPTQVEELDGNEDDADEIVAEADDGQHEDPQEQEEQYADISLPPPPPPPRPDTEAQQRAREVAEAEQKEKEERARQKALRGIQKALEFSELTEPWVEVLVGVANVEDGRSTSQEESARGKGVRRKIDKIHQDYRELRRGNTLSSLGFDQRTAENMKVLKKRCADINELRSQDHLQDRERLRTVRDVYQTLIPSAVRLAKEVLRARFVDNVLGFEAHKELLRFLKIASALIETARQWSPRPALDNGIKSIVEGIDTNLNSIISKYEDVVLAGRAAAHREKLALRQKADEERLLAAKQERDAELKAIRREQRAQYYEKASRRQQRPTSEYVLRVDDTTVRPSWPRDRRQATPTEEIPPPAQTRWTDEQTIVLLEALQKFRDASRFEDIFEHHGGPQGKLRNFDMDQLMAQARYIKRSMSDHLAKQSPSDPQWSWLISCP